jgi:rubrerythrin
MDIQTEVQKIHHQFGVSEKANYEIQKLFDKAIKEAVTEALRIHDVVGRSEQLVCDRCNGKHNNITPCPKCGGLSESLFEAN